jgi:hypothetical protein
MYVAPEQNRTPLFDAVKKYADAHVIKRLLYSVYALLTLRECS